MRYLDPVTLARLRNLRLGSLRRRAEGASGGRHRSVSHAFAQEFAQHRAYAPGDELKFLDWKVYARKDRYFIRQSQEEQSLRAYLLVDASGSMAFRHAGERSKYDHAAALAVALAYLVLRDGDSAGLVTFDTQPGALLPPRQSLAQLDWIDSALAGRKPGGETDLGAVLRRVGARLARRSVVVVLSDLLGEPAKVLEAVKAFRARRHEVLAIQILDPAERDLDFEGPVRFEDLETEATLLCDVATVRQAYREVFDRQLRLYESGFHQSGIPFAAVYTDERPDRSLERLLALVR
ncbi:MAG: DUF58 domain-containing protein [Elusimicrobia bacterium]|nr:DUF58 domain-containing protein [Elusimicrobiota bacterium]